MFVVAIALLISEKMAFTRYLFTQRLVKVWSTLPLVAAVPGIIIVWIGQAYH